MKTLLQFITESDDLHQAAAKRGFDKLMDGAKSVGSHSGNARVYYKQKGGTLTRTFVGDHDHFSYSMPTRYSGSGHYFAMHYSAKPGHNAYVHVKLPREYEFDDKAHLEKEIEKQNPHTKNTGHGAVLAADIMKHHGKK